MSGRVKPPVAGSSRPRSRRRRGRASSPGGVRTAHRAPPSGLASRAEIDAFFNGVEEMREYLDRHIQDPERRRGRLARMAQELVRPRSAQELGTWLTTQICDALGARSCAILLAELDWRVWQTGGEGEAGAPEAPLLERLRRPGAEAGPVTEGDVLGVGMHGIDELLGAIWIRGGTLLDAASSAILQALADTAGVVLEQALRVEALSRDSQTGLLLEGAFIERARALCASAQGAGHVTGLIGFRVAGIEAIRAAKGLRAARAAVQQLSRAALEALGDDALLGVRFDDVVAACCDLPRGRAELELTARARAVDTALRRRTAEAHPTLAACAAYLIPSRPLPHLSTALERLSRQLGRLPAGALVRVEDGGSGS